MAQIGTFGSQETLEEVVDFYNRGGVKNPWLSSDIKPLGLTADEQNNLLASLRSLTGEIDPEVEETAGLAPVV